MKKLNKLLFPQKWEEKVTIRLYIVMIYVFLVFSIIFNFYSTINSTLKQWNLLLVTDVNRELNFTLLNSSISSQTVKIIENSKIKNSDKYLDGYKYYNQLIYDDIPDLSYKYYKEGNYIVSENIELLNDSFQKNIENYWKLRAENFTIMTAIIDSIVYLFLLIIPIFIFFRSIVYRIVLYIIYGKEIIQNNKK